ncbi:hypothetical protein NMG60_11029994 [Bertholletia excelsa]
MEWMKNTASSCMAMAAINPTPMFSVAFTIPGDYRGGTGNPPHRGSSYIFAFIILDTISLLFSSISIIIFLAMQASLYREEDFLINLLMKLTCAFFTLFLSMVALMVGFSISIILILRGGYLSIALAIISPCLVVAFVTPSFILSGNFSSTRV